MKRKTKKKKTITISLSLPMWRMAELKKISKLAGTTMNQTIMVILANELCKEKRESKLHQPRS